MKVLRKVSLILAAVLLLLLAAGCQPQGGPPATSQPVPPPAGNGDSEGGEGEGLKIAIVTSPSGVDDGSFNQDNYNGILAFISTHPSATVKAVQETTGDTNAALAAVADIVADYDVIVTPGFQFAGVSSLAAENPEKKFILIDSAPSPVGEQTEFENIYAMTFAEEESGFFAGMAAALETQSGKVAVINGIAYPSNVNYQWGFESGVHYVNALYEKNVEIVELASYAGTDVTGANVGGNYAGSFADPSAGKVLGNALIAEGCDVLFVAAGGTGNGVFTAAKEAAGVKVIGCDVDQFDDGAYDGGNIILTSALKNMNVNVVRTLEAIEAGTFKGGNVLLKADTDSTGFVKAEGRHQMSADTVEKLDTAYGLLKAGEIVPAANFNGIAPDNFPGLPGYTG